MVKAELEAVVAALRAGEADWPEVRQDWLSSALRAFCDMLDRDAFPLTPSQESWVRDVAEVVDVVLPEPARGPVPRGREVALLFVKGPLAPPGRRP